MHAPPHASPTTRTHRRPSRFIGGLNVCLGTLLLLAVTSASHAAECQTDCTRQFPVDSLIINVRDFGAKGDGRADDTASLRAAINAAGTNTGAFFWRTRIVFLPAG